MIKLELYGDCEVNIVHIMHVLKINISCGYFRMVLFHDMIDLHPVENKIVCSAITPYSDILDTMLLKPMFIYQAKRPKSTV